MAEAPSFSFLVRCLIVLMLSCSLLALGQNLKVHFDATIEKKCLEPEINSFDSYFAAKVIVAKTALPYD